LLVLLVLCLRLLLLLTLLVLLLLLLCLLRLLRQRLREPQRLGIHRLLHLPLFLRLCCRRSLSCLLLPPPLGVSCCRRLAG
jgi:hypothetical protein